MQWSMRVCRLDGIGFPVFLCLITKVSVYIISKYEGLCRGVVCVLFVWMVGGVGYVM